MSEQPPNPPSGGGGQMQNPFQGLNVDKVKAAGVPTQLVLGGGVVFFIAGFFPWYSASAGGFDVTINAFDDWRGWFPWLLMIAAAVLALLQLVRGAEQNFVYATLAVTVLSVLLVLWYWAAASPDYDFPGVDVGPSFGIFLALIAAVAATVGAFMSFQAFKKAQ